MKSIIAVIALLLLGYFLSSTILPGTPLLIFYWGFCLGFIGGELADRFAN